VQRPRAQVGRADRVRVVDDRGPPLVVAPDGHGQAEGENERHEPEQGSLDDTERLTQRLGVRAQPAADEAPRSVAPSTIPKIISPSSRVLSRKNMVADHARALRRSSCPP